MARRNRLPPGDDGHTIISMNVDGMPGFREEPPEKAATPPQAPLSGRETRWMILGSLKAALLVGAVFAMGIALFVLVTIKISGQ